MHYSRILASRLAPYIGAGVFASACTGSYGNTVARNMCASVFASAYAGFQRLGSNHVGSPFQRCTKYSQFNLVPEYFIMHGRGLTSRLRPS